MTDMLNGTSAERGFILAFRDFARDIKKPKPYQPGSTECKGVLNIIIGLGNFLVCPYFKCFKATQRYYDIHLKFGKESLCQGIKDLSRMIGVALVASAGLAAWRWDHRNNSDINL